LTAVEHADRAGKYLLALLRCSGAHLIASGTLMTELVRTIAGDWPVKEAFDAPAGDGGDTLASKENDLSHSLRLNSLLAFAVSVAALAAGCGDTSRATGAPRHPRSGSSP